MILAASTDAASSSKAGSMYGAAFKLSRSSAASIQFPSPCGMSLTRMRIASGVAIPSRAQAAQPPGSACSATCSTGTSVASQPFQYSRISPALLRHPGWEPVARFSSSSFAGAPKRSNLRAITSPFSQSPVSLAGTTLSRRPMHDSSVLHWSKPLGTLMAKAECVSQANNTNKIAAYRPS